MEPEQIFSRWSAALAVQPSIIGAIDAPVRIALKRDDGTIETFRLVSSDCTISKCSSDLPLANDEAEVMTSVAVFVEMACGLKNPQEAFHEKLLSIRGNAVALIGLSALFELPRTVCGRNGPS